MLFCFFLSPVCLCVSVCVFFFSLIVNLLYIYIFFFHFVRPEGIITTCIISPFHAGLAFTILLTQSLTMSTQTSIVFFFFFLLFFLKCIVPNFNNHQSFKPFTFVHFRHHREWGSSDMFSSFFLVFLFYIFFF